MWTGSTKLLGLGKASFQSLAELLRLGYVLGRHIDVTVVGRTRTVGVITGTAGNWNRSLDRLLDRSRNSRRFMERTHWRLSSNCFDTVGRWRSRMRWNHLNIGQLQRQQTPFKCVEEIQKLSRLQNMYTIMYKRFFVRYQ